MVEKPWKIMQYHHGITFKKLFHLMYYETFHILNWNLYSWNTFYNPTQIMLKYFNIDLISLCWYVSMFAGIYLLVIIFINIKYLSFFSFSVLYFSQVKWKPTLLLTKLIITFGLSIPNTTWKSNEISDSLYSLY